MDEKKKFIADSWNELGFICPLWNLLMWNELGLNPVIATELVTELILDGKLLPLIPGKVHLNPTVRIGPTEIVLEVRKGFGWHSKATP